jgi:hypothetical protein
MLVNVTISVEILEKNRYKQIKEKTMVKKAKDPKAVPELGVGKDGYKTGWRTN